MIPNYFAWTIPDVEYVERWNYREFQKYIPGDSSEKKIRSFIEDAKAAQEAIKSDMMDLGYDEKTAVRKACQWPLRDETPLEIIRNFLDYNYEIQEAAIAGIDL